jgi:hypothetical protein
MVVMENYLILMEFRNGMVAVELVQTAITLMRLSILVD